MNLPFVAAGLATHNMGLVALGMLPSPNDAAAAPSAAASMHEGDFLPRCAHCQQLLISSTATATACTALNLLHE